MLSKTIFITFYFKVFAWCSPCRMGFLGGSAGKEFACNARDLRSIPGLGRSPGEGNSYPLWYSGLENFRDCIGHGETGETVSDFILGGSKITEDDDCSHEIKRCSLLGRKVMTNIDSILKRQHIKNRNITLPIKVHLVKASAFPVV